MNQEKVRIKYCKKANMWCRTTFPDGKQKQEWFSKKPKEQDDE